MCKTKKICHPEFKHIYTPCGCCPCNWEYYFDVSDANEEPKFKSIRIAELMEQAKSDGYRVHIERNSTPGEGPIKISFEKLQDQSKDQSCLARLLISTTKKTNRGTTQSERTKARKMKKRQLHQVEIAAKRANTITTSHPFPTKSMNDNAQASVDQIETTKITKIPNNQKKRPKTHFRKTKKPGRA